MTPSTSLQGLARAIDNYLSEARGESLSQVLSSAEAAQTLLAKHLAVLVRGPLSDYVKTQGQETFEDKRSLATAIDRQLQKLGLAVRMPDTDEPAVIVAQNTADGRGVFAFVSTASEPVDSVLETLDVLPTLELMPAPPRREFVIASRRALVHFPKQVGIRR